MGPSSVANKLETEALCFGGSHCTATDIAIASGIAPASICKSEEGRVKVGGLGAAMVYAAMREMRRKLEATIDSVKVYTIRSYSFHTSHIFVLTPLSFPQVTKEDVPVLLVGGGGILVDCQVLLKGASRVIIPEKFGVSRPAEVGPRTPPLEVHDSLLGSSRVARV